jgi:hypothetical protein
VPWTGAVLVSGELARWAFAGPAQREKQRATTAVRTNTAVAVARIGGIAQASQAAMVGMVGVSMAKREAALLVPEDAGKFDLIATQAALSMAAQINWLAHQW